MAREEWKRIKEICDGEEIEVIYSKANDPATNRVLYQEYNPGTEVIDGILKERDVPVTLRSGNQLLTDILRPETEGKYPAIIAWGSAGKNYNFVNKGGSMGIVPDDVNSALMKQEGPDPGYWCHYGYAVINPDTPGVNNVDGDIKFTGLKDAEDCYDLIEWVAQQPWCNGKVAMTGTAFAGISAWFAAALQPPHLACIAPWDAAFDIYRGIVNRGGILDEQMMSHVMTRMYGNEGVEDIVLMSKEHPCIDGYWREKRAEVEKINIPVYFTASINMFHCQGLEAWSLMEDNPRKWLRITPRISWHDLYRRENLDELRAFFDRYTKNIYNGWEFTDPVRYVVFDSEGTREHIPAKDWPLENVRNEKFYLDAAAMELKTENPETAALAEYTADGTGSMTFTYTFDRDVEVVGYGKLHLNVETDKADDMDIYVAIQHFDRNGKPMKIPMVGQPHGGVSGILRVSHRKQDKERSTKAKPFLTHEREEKMTPGTVYAVDVPLWPFGFAWHKGETLKLIIMDTQKRVGAGADMLKAMDTDAADHGKNMFHTGGENESYLMLPVLKK